MKNDFSGGVVLYETRISEGVPTRFYLLLNYQKGYWDFPKGRLEKDETALDAAHRELAEETGLKATFHDEFEKDLRYTFKSPEGVIINKKVTYFVGVALSHEVTISHEHKGFIWLPFDEALQKLTYLNARTMLTDAENFLKTRKRIGCGGWI